MSRSFNDMKRRCENAPELFERPSTFDAWKEQIKYWFVNGKEKISTTNVFRLDKPGAMVGCFFGDDSKERALRYIAMDADNRKLIAALEEVCRKHSEAPDYWIEKVTLVEVIE